MLYRLVVRKRSHRPDPETPLISGREAETVAQAWTVDRSRDVELNG